MGFSRDSNKMFIHNCSDHIRSAASYRAPTIFYSILSSPLPVLLPFWTTSAPTVLERGPGGAQPPQ
jgi:hypothetical protein